MKKKVTQEDLDNNPDLVEAGVKVGEEIDIPETDDDDEGDEEDEKSDEGGE